VIVTECMRMLQTLERDALESARSSQFVQSDQANLAVQISAEKFRFAVEQIEIKIRSIRLPSRTLRR
jgi:hypothetical protein